MRIAFAMLAVCAAVPAFSPASPVGEGLEALRADVRDELRWLESLESGTIEAFLEKYCPATLMVINKLGARLATAEPAEKTELRGELAGFVEDRVYLYREFRQYQKLKQTQKAKWTTSFIKKN